MAELPKQITAGKCGTAKMFTSLEVKGIENNGQSD